MCSRAGSGPPSIEAAADAGLDTRGHCTDADCPMSFIELGDRGELLALHHGLDVDGLVQAARSTFSPHPPHSSTTDTPDRSEINDPGRDR